MDDWRANLIDDAEMARRLLADARRLAIIGIKPETHASQPAYYVSEYLHDAGYQIVPVPCYYPDVTQIFGIPVHRNLAAVPGPIDMVVVFRRPADVMKHVDDILAKQPGSVWLQQGIRNEVAAERWARVGIKVVQNRCTMIDHRRTAMTGGRTGS